MNSLNTLFATAAQDGAIGNATAQVLAIPDLGAQIQAGLGVSVDDISASEVVLVTMLVDDSGSISAARNEASIIDGCNVILDSLLASKQSGGVLVSIRYLNGIVLMPYTPLDQAIRLSSTNYSANGSTPLYDQSVVTLGQVLAKTQEFTDAGVVCRSVTVIPTDGADCRSMRNTAGDVAKIVSDMLRSESHIVIGMGISDGSTDFGSVFASMGIQDKWILTPSNDPSSIRRAFAVVSQSATRASQGAGAFSQTAQNGFTSP